MKRVAIALLFLASAAPIVAKPPKLPKPAAEKPAPVAEKPINAAFRAAFGKGDSVILKKQGRLKEDVKYTPGELVDAPFGKVLLSPGEVQDGKHENAGKLAIFYLKPSDKGFEIEKKFIPAAEAGSFGKIVDWSVNNSFGNLPVVTVNGAGNWQGLSCSTATLVELTPYGPRHLVTLPMTYDDSAAATAAGKKYTQVSGRIDNIQPGKSFDVVYFGSSKEFTEHYVRKDNVYVLASGGQSKVQRC